MLAVQGIAVPELGELDGHLAEPPVIGIFRKSKSGVPFQEIYEKSLP
jgi:hypothetical protein